MTQENQQNDTVATIATEVLQNDTVAAIATEVLPNDTVATEVLQPHLRTPLTVSRKYVSSRKKKHKRRHTLTSSPRLASTVSVQRQLSKHKCTCHNRFRRCKQCITKIEKTEVPLDSQNCLQCLKVKLDSDNNWIVKHGVWLCEACSHTYTKDSVVLICNNIMLTRDWQDNQPEKAELNWFEMQIMKQCQTIAKIQNLKRLHDQKRIVYLCDDHFFTLGTIVNSSQCAISTRLRSSQNHVRYTEHQMLMVISQQELQNANHFNIKCETIVKESAAKLLFLVIRPDFVHKDIQTLSQILIDNDMIIIVSIGETGIDLESGSLSWIVGKNSKGKIISLTQKQYLSVLFQSHRSFKQIILYLSCNFTESKYSYYDIYSFTNTNQIVLRPLSPHLSTNFVMDTIFNKMYHILFENKFLDQNFWSFSMDIITHLDKFNVRSAVHPLLVNTMQCVNIYKLHRNSFGPDCGRLFKKWTIFKRLKQYKYHNKQQWHIFVQNSLETETLFPHKIISKIVHFLLLKIFMQVRSIQSLKSFSIHKCNEIQELILNKINQNNSEQSFGFHEEVRMRTRMANLFDLRYYLSSNMLWHYIETNKEIVSCYSQNFLSFVNIQSNFAIDANYWPNGMLYIWPKPFHYNHRHKIMSSLVFGDNKNIFMLHNQYLFSNKNKDNAQPAKKKRKL